MLIKFDERELNAVRGDGWANPYTGMSGAADVSQYSYVVPSVRLADEELTILFQESDFIRKVCEAHVEGAMSGGFAVRNRPQIAGEKYMQAVMDAAVWARLYGAGYIYLDFGGDVSKPVFGLPKLRAFRSIEGYRVNVPKWNAITGEPAMYSVNGIHIDPSRMILIRGLRTPAREREGRGRDWSAIDPVLVPLRDDAEITHAITTGVKQSNQGVWKIQGLAQMIANGRKDDLMARLQLSNMLRSVTNATVVDAEKESFSVEGSANRFAIGEAVRLQWERVAAAAEIPQNILLGRAPAGFSSTGEGDFRGWYATLTKFRTFKLAPALARLIAADTGLLESEITIEWPSLWVDAPADLADADLKKAQATKALVEAGVITRDEARERHGINASI